MDFWFCTGPFIGIPGYPSGLLESPISWVVQSPMFINQLVTGLKPGFLWPETIDVPRKIMDGFSEKVPLSQSNEFCKNCWTITYGICSEKIWEICDCLVSCASFRLWFVNPLTMGSTGLVQYLQSHTSISEANCYTIEMIHWYILYCERMEAHRNGQVSATWICCFSQFGFPIII